MSPTMPKSAKAPTKSAKTPTKSAKAVAAAITKAVPSRQYKSADDVSIYLNEINDLAKFHEIQKEAFKTRPPYTGLNDETRLAYEPHSAKLIIQDAQILQDYDRLVKAAFSRRQFVDKPIKMQTVDKYMSLSGVARLDELFKMKLKSILSLPESSIESITNNINGFFKAASIGLYNHIFAVQLDSTGTGQSIPALYGITINELYERPITIYLLGRWASFEKFVVDKVGLFPDPIFFTDDSFYKITLAYLLKYEKNLYLDRRASNPSIDEDNYDRRLLLEVDEDEEQDEDTAEDSTYYTERYETTPANQEADEDEDEDEVGTSSSRAARDAGLLDSITFEPKPKRGPKGARTAERNQELRERREALKEYNRAKAESDTSINQFYAPDEDAEIEDIINNPFARYLAGETEDPTRTPTRATAPDTDGVINALEEKQGEGMRFAFKNHDIIRIGKNGKFKMNKTKLIDSNTFGVQWSSTGVTAAGFKQQPVSDKFVKLTLMLLDKNKLKKADMLKLSEHEGLLLSKFMELLEIGDKIGHGITTNIKQKRLQILEGQIQAGNNNPKILQEADLIMRGLVKSNIISKGDKASHIAQLKAFMAGNG